MDFFFILTLSLLSLFHVDGCQIYKEGVTFFYDPNVDIVLPGLDTFEACRAKCEQMESYAGYTFEEGIVNLCYLYTRTDEKVSCSNCKSGILQKKYTGSGCTLDPEHILEDVVVNSAEECLEHCQNKYTCRDYVYFNSESLLKNMCFLYYDCPEIGTCDGCESGRLDCFDSAPAECANYQVLDDSTRNNEYSNDFMAHSESHTEFCDKSGDKDISPDWHGTGWYRMLGPAGVRLPEEVPDYFHCGTTKVGWTRDKHPAEVGQRKDMTACFHWEDGDCYKQTRIKATNCRDYFVYYLVDVPDCHIRYCATF